MQTPNALTGAAAVERVVQQSVKDELGEYLALRVCVPTCFYMLGKANGYLEHGEGSDLVSFANSMDWDKDFHPQNVWVRPKLADTLRDIYGMSIVSWQVHGNHDATEHTLMRMKAAGYLRSDREKEFYRDHVVGKSVEDVVRAGYPAIVGMLPGFGANKDVHAVVIAEWTDDKVEVIDPDERNLQHEYSPDYVREHINPTGGGCTVVLPREH